MNIAREYQLLAQQLLNLHGAGLKEDGIFGPASDHAADRIHGRELPPERNIALAVQRAWNAAPVTIGGTTGTYRPYLMEDAFWGPLTLQAAEELQAARLGKITPPRPDEKAAARIPATQCHDGTCSAVRCWSPRDAQMEAHYGGVGEHQQLIPVPFALVLDWDPATAVKRISVHRKVAADVQSALEQILEHYGIGTIRALGLDRFGGSLNVRKKRGGTTWSAHAWGTALDFWPAVNALREDHTTARFARPHYAPFFAIWEAHGFMSLGRCFDFDWMHIQKNPPA